MTIVGTVIVVLICIIVLALGAFLTYKPAEAIELQRKFYELINWRMEPISMPKEIRKTCIMGVFVIVSASVAMVYVVWFR